MKILNDKETRDYFYATNFNGSVHDAFDEGVDYAEQKLIPLMVEFVEETIGDGWILHSDGWQNVMDFKISELDRYTTQQLLEQFIKHKQDESTEMS